MSLTFAMSTLTAEERTHRDDVKAQLAALAARTSKGQTADPTYLNGPVFGKKAAKVPAEAQVEPKKNTRKVQKKNQQKVAKAKEKAEALEEQLKVKAKQREIKKVSRARPISRRC